MDQQKAIVAIEGRAAALGLSVAELCRRANVHPTTFSRWKLSPNNPAPIGPNFRTLERLQSALTDLEAARAQLPDQKAFCSTYPEPRTVTCIACDRDLTGTGARGCGALDCPQADCEAA